MQTRGLLFDTERFAMFEGSGSPRVLPFVDLVLYDFKHADPAAHRTYAGVSNEVILENLKKIDERGQKLQARRHGGAFE